ncbi:Acetate-CoA ligase [Moorella glycerini]|uniref:Acetyl-coenzyme A synthetase n=1 Tax=Neomoorella stamsii TaxID=1266720 RepID=A0A9X7J4E9_9FIRM|nr:MULTISPECIES: acetate--CoA ligase [Moorella]PRR73489.1 Acetyl-coenzyme A synthetase [Moorella stamsii]CEP69258.1 Acetate-CoA ligase [Moorella glycerini]
MSKDTRTIEALLKENRTFPPPPAFAAVANARDAGIYKEGEDMEKFWAREAAQLHWFRPWDRVLEWEYPLAWWFNGGTLNVSYNCLDRHLETWRRNKAALIWEGEPGDSVVLTYRDLYREVNKFAACLRSLGVRRNDRVTIYLPMIPELPIAMLACTRIGAVHNVVFGGFSAAALRDRINDIGAKVLITADGGFRKGRVVALKEHADTALAETPTIEKVIVTKRTGERVNMQPGRDLWWHELMAAAPLYTPPEHMEAEDPLFILHTSGTTGKPKGVVHTTAGYLVGVTTTSRYVFDLKDEDVYWCTADIGWITGHSYVVYGPLANGATVLMYEGSPDYPQPDRYWQIIEKYGVTIFYTAPTAIRSFMRAGPAYPARHDLSSLRLLGTVGEPINPEAWMWYYNYIGHRRCPIVDTWWQTETGMILITPLPGLTPLKPGSAFRPFPGVEAAVVDDRGEPVPPGKGGYLVIKKPWPAMMRTIFNDPERYVNQYWNRIPGYYFTGDGARVDEDGYFWLLGRVDDVINVSGHRIGTMEVESALVDHPDVAEAAVISREHEIKGQAIVAFVTVKDGVEATPRLAQELKEHVVQKIGALARPEAIFFTAELPKTRSGKIMRRLLRDIAEGRALGDTSTLADPATVAKLKAAYAEEA